MFSKVLDFWSVLTIFVSISSFVHGAIWAPQNTGQEQVCRTDKCLKRGNEYFDNLSPAVHPCDDFYTFVCGGWYTQHKPPEFLPEWTMRDVMVQRVIKDLKEILDKPASPFDRELTQVKFVYDICMKKPYLGRLNPKDVAKHIVTIRRSGKYKIWDMHHQYLLLTSESPFFVNSIYGYPNSFGVPLVLLSQMESPYGMINHVDWKDEEENNYLQFLFLLMKSLKLPTDDSALKAKIRQVFHFREILAKICDRARDKTSPTFEPRTAHGFQEWFAVRDVKGGKPKHPEMPWKKIIKTILTDDLKQFHDKTIVWARDDTYFKELEQLLSVTSEQVLVDHIEIYFAEKHTILTSELEDLLEKTAIEPHDIVQPIRQDIPRYIACIKGNNMFPQIGNILQRKWFRNDIVPPMNEMFEGLKLSMVAQVKDSTWLNSQTKVSTMNKIVDTESWIGYPPWYTDPSTDLKSESLKNNPLYASAAMHLEKLVVYIKSPLLQSPIYDPEMPNVYNLGGIGYVIGHELYHIIQNCGMYYDPEGQPVNWWSQEMRERCAVQMKCFIDSYNSQTRKEFAWIYHQKIEGGNPGSFLENYPDVMGLDSSFQLYKVLKRKDPSVCQTLPRFEKYSCEQMFFITFGNTLCGKATSKAARHQIKTAYHSLDSVRVNGAVMNNKAFAKAFQCPTGKPMNPEIKCNLWK